MGFCWLNSPLGIKELQVYAPDLLRVFGFWARLDTIGQISERRHTG